MKRLSIVLPSYNEEQMIGKTARVLSEMLESQHIDYELVFVDDGSKDNTWKIIEKVCKKNEKVVGIHFSRNFGKESAIFAGLANISGDCCIVMDCDLQHPPETAIEMYRMWENGYEVVEGVKRSRGKENPFHKACAGMFYNIMSRAVKFDMSRASDFKLMDKQVVKSLLEMPERSVFFRALSSWVGFRSTSIEFDVREREAGESKWSVWSLVKYAVTNIVSFSAAPMQLVTIFGVFTFMVGIVLGIQTLYRYFGGQAVEGFTTVILLILLIGSIIMVSLGIIGYYISKIYEEVKRRPRYIVSKIVRNREVSK